ncbi:unnamed protein product [Phyllotreta striolata]|uniref:M-phase phosphoprotein 6 n=1 Tax=Phyllotreta striolata TaxID=444603 RepID=A0A9N9XMP8_PHYSR|nr:unnamed protein product [Phyllotreta striolata]
MTSQNQEVQLSKTILEMKFMKKTKEKVEKALEDKEGNAMYSNEITEEMRRSGNLVFVSTSITNCKNLIDGRLSFGGMNADIEKIMANEFAKLVEQEEKKKEKDVTDVEMAQGYSTLVNNMAKKFNKKSKNKNKKSKKGNDQVE